MQRHLDPKVKAQWLAPQYALLIVFWALAIASIYVFDSDRIVFGMSIFLAAIISFAGMAALLFFPLYIYYSKEYDGFTYELTDNEIIIRQGVFSTNTNVLPYARVSRVELCRSLPDMLLGLVSISIITPGPSESKDVTHVLAGVSVKDGVIDEINARMSGAKKEAPAAAQKAQYTTDRAILLAMLLEMRHTNASLSSLLAALRAPPAKK
ncbi:MAG: PH domain-containing protein [Candidatus Micrarchaeia archaeon]